jgi:ribonucleoside-triphosphate reductase
LKERNAKMINKIQKRDGSIAEFDSWKISEAILKAGRATKEFGRPKADKLTLEVLKTTSQFDPSKILTVEKIQDIVEKVLLGSPYSATAKAYIIYRNQHQHIRNINSQATISLVNQYVEKSDWKVSENSNMSYSLQGLNNYISSNITAEYWLSHIYPPEVGNAHKTGDIHIHDLNLLGVYCVGWDLEDLLRTGFRGVEGKVESAPPKHLRSALGQIVNFFYTLQGEAAGAQAFSNFDTLLAPFVYIDNLEYKDVKQAIQEFIFNLNIPTRVGFQTPFTNLTMDLQCPSSLSYQPIVIGGVERPYTYASFQKEMDMINRAFAEVMMDGDATGRVFTFPIPTYNITSDFDWDNPSLEIVWKMTGKYGIPYFSNFINSDMSPEDARSMCCRLRLDKRELLKRGGGLFGANPLTGSVGVVTINMPRIGYKSQSQESFFKQLNDQVNLAIQSLDIKRKVLEQFTEKNLYPYSKFYLRDVRQRSGAYWKNHFSTVGVIGMNEACLNFLGLNIGTQEGNGFAVMVMDFLRAKMAQTQENSENIYNLEATPAESTTYRLALLDKKQYPNILCANETAYSKGAAPFYTNSTQLPVDYTEDIFELLTLQDNLQSKYTGGTVLHLFLGEQIPDAISVKSLIKKIASDFKLPYFTLTPTFSVCSTHGYIPGESPSCGICGKPTEIYSRVVGYFRPIKQWNEGKQAEYQLRKVVNQKEVAHA